MKVFLLPQSFCVVLCKPHKIVHCLLFIALIVTVGACTGPAGVFLLVQLLQHDYYLHVNVSTSLLLNLLSILLRVRKDNYV